MSLKEVKKQRYDVNEPPIREIQVKEIKAWTGFGGEFKSLVDRVNSEECTGEDYERVFKLLDGGNGNACLRLLRQGMNTPEYRSAGINILSNYASSRGDSSRGITAVHLLAEGLSGKETRRDCTTSLKFLTDNKDKLTWKPTLVAKEAVSCLAGNMENLGAGIAGDRKIQPYVSAVCCVSDRVMFGDQQELRDLRACIPAAGKVLIDNIDVIRQAMLMEKESTYVYAIANAAYACGKRDLPKILEAMKTAIEDKRYREDLLSSFAFKLTRRDDETPRRPEVAGFLADNIQLIEDDLRKNNREAMEFLAEVVSTDTSYWRGLRKKAVEAVDRNIKSLKKALISEKTSVDEHALHILASRMETNPEAEKTLREYIKGKIGEGFDVDVAMKEWPRSNRKNPGRAIKRNISAIESLRFYGKPDVARELYETFGIATPGRYNYNTLVRLHGRMGVKPGKPLIVVAFPRDDSKGSFYGDDNWIDKLSRDHNLVIVEAGGKLELGKRLARTVKNYGLISGIVIGGHGTETDINFGGEEPEKQLQLEDLAGSGIRRTGKWFTEDPAILLDSCSTGARRAIGEKIARILGGRLSAPKKPTSIEDADAVIVKDKIHFKVVWKDEDAGREYTPDKPRWTERD